MEKNNLIRLLHQKNNLLILINEDGKQEIYLVEKNHVLTLMEILKNRDFDLYKKIIKNSSLILGDFVPVATEFVKKNIIIICKSVDVYGIYLSGKNNNKQIMKLLLDIMLINKDDELYSALYSEETDSYKYYNDGCYMKKKKFIKELTKQEFN